MSGGEDAPNDALPLIGAAAEASAQASEEKLKSPSDPDSEARTLAHAAGRRSRGRGRVTGSSFLDLEVKSLWKTRLEPGSGRERGQVANGFC